MKIQTHHSHETNSIKCRNCGANLKFSPEKNKLICDGCGSENEIIEKETVIEEIDFHQYVHNEKIKSEHRDIVLITCENCGASTRFDENIIADQCSFCQTPLSVINASHCDIIQPKSILPFSIERKKASQEFNKWIKERWFAPNDLLKISSKPENLTGIYLPFWTYDSKSITKFKGQRGEATGPIINNTRMIVWTNVSGKINNEFDDILIPASKSIDQKYLSALEPWSLNELQPFDEKYLSGFKAESYRMNLTDGFIEAKKYMDFKNIQNVKREIGGQHQQIDQILTQYSEVKFKSILLPVWLSTYKYKNQIFHFVINAKTGEVQGKRPFSRIKLFLFTLIALANIIGLYFVLKYGEPTFAVVFAIISTLLVLIMTRILLKVWIQL